MDLAISVLSVKHWIQLVTFLLILFSPSSLLIVSVRHGGQCPRELVPNHVDTDALSAEQIYFPLSSDYLAF